MLSPEPQQTCLLASSTAIQWSGRHRGTQHWREVLLVFAVCLFSCFHFTDVDHACDELKLEHCLVGYCRFSLRVEELSQDVEERRLKGLSFIHNYYI